MTGLQKYIESQKNRGVSYKYIQGTFGMSRQTFSQIKKTGDISSMSIRKALEISKLTGLSIEGMMGLI